MYQTNRSRSAAAEKSKPYVASRKSGPAAKPGKSKIAPQKAKRGRLTFPAVFLFVAVAGIAAAVITMWVRSYYRETIIEGVSVNGRNLHGMTREQARVMLLSELEPLFDNARVRLSYGDREWTMDAQALRMSMNLEEALDRADALGHTGSFSERRAQANQTKNQPVDFAVDITFDEGTIRELIAAAAQEIDAPPVDAVANFDPTMDDPQLMFSFRDEQPGSLTDQEAAFQAVLAGISGDWQADVELRVEPVQPLVTAEFLRGCTAQISYFGTNIRQSMDDPRTSNINLALSAFDGLTVYPGEEVSFNTMTGERTMAKGYQEALQIGPDKNLEPALGGGVCQASTTMYNAVMLAGLEIVTRNRHSWPSTYVKEGFDAAVNWPDKDFVFKNNTAGPIFIKAGVYYEQGQGVNARVWIYGIPLPDGQYYDRAWEVVERLDPPESEIKPDEKQEYTDYVYYDDEQYVYRESHGSLKIQTYRVLKDAAGAEISREPLFLDHYKPITGLIYTGIVPASKRPPDVNGDGIPDVDSDGDGEVDMLDLDGDRVGDVAWTPPEEEDPGDGGGGGG